VLVQARRRWLAGCGEGRHAVERHGEELRGRGEGEEDRRGMAMGWRRRRTSERILEFEREEMITSLRSLVALGWYGLRMAWSVGLTKQTLNPH